MYFLLLYVYIVCFSCMCVYFIFSIYRKPTTTDLIIHNDSCHPTDHTRKYSAIRYLINRMNTYPISTKSKHNELQLINTILHNNNYPPQIHTHTKRRHRTKTRHPTYHKIKNGQHLHILAKKQELSLDYSDIRIAYKTKGTI
jgi:hypothetical protein